MYSSLANVLSTVAHDVLVAVVVGITFVAVLAAVIIGLWLPGLLGWVDGGRETGGMVAAYVDTVCQPPLSDATAPVAPAEEPVIGTRPAAHAASPLLFHGSPSFWR